MARGISGRLFAFVEKEGGRFATHPHFSFQVWGVYLNMTQPFFSCPCMCDPLFISETPRWAPVSLLLLSLVFGDGAVDANICYPISMIATVYIRVSERQGRCLGKGGGMSWRFMASRKLQDPCFSRALLFVQAFTPHLISLFHFTTRTHRDSHMIKSFACLFLDPCLDSCSKHLLIIKTESYRQLHIF